MELAKKLALGVLAMIMVSVGVTLKMGVFDWMVLVGTFFGILSYGIPTAILHFTRGDRKKVLDKKDLASCLKAINRELRSPTGGTAIRWDEGLDRNVELKRYKSPDGNLVPFLAIRTHTNNDQGVVIIADVEEERIVRYNSSPPPQMLANPWYKFDPFNIKAQMRSGYQPFGARGRRRKGVTLHWGDEQDDYNQDYSPEPNQELINKTIQGMGKGEEIGGGN